MTQGPDGRPGVPAIFADHSLSPRGASRRAEDEQHGNISGGIGQHIRRIGYRDPALPGGCKVDMFVADRESGHDPHRARQAGHEIRSEIIGRRDQQAVALPCRFKDFILRHDVVVRIEPRLIGFRQAMFNFLWELAGDQHAGGRRNHC